MNRVLVVLLVVANVAALTYVVVRLGASEAEKASLGVLVTELREKHERTVREVQATTAQLRKQLSAATAELERMTVLQAQREKERTQRQTAIEEAEQRLIAGTITQVSKGAQSLSSETPTDIRIINRDPEQSYSVYWLNYHGDPVLYRTLEPGQEYVQSTFINHPWAFINRHGVAVKQVFIPRDLKYQTVVLKGTDFQLIEVEVPDERTKPTTPTGTNEF